MGDEAHAKPWHTYVVGGKDRKGRTITNMFSFCDEYAIYEAAGTLQMDGSFDRVNRCGPLNSLLNDAVVSRPSHPHRRRTVFQQLAVALDVCQNGNDEDAITILDRLVRRLERNRVLEAQSLYLAGCMIPALCGVVPVLLHLGEHQTIMGLNILRGFQVSVFGAIGGILSVALRINRLDLDPEAQWWLTMVAGLTRAIIAMIAAVFIVLAVKAHLVLGFASSASGAGLSAMAITAGVSETLVPNLLRDTESGIGRRMNRHGGSVRVTTETVELENHAPAVVPTRNEAGAEPEDMGRKR